MTPLHTALFERHLALGARMVPFGGWEMPLDYGSTVAEHLRCRADAVVFDVSHLGTVRLTGSDAFDRLQATFTNDLGRIGPGRAQYSHLCGPDGSVLDDVIIWWHPDSTDADAAPVFDVMPNASNTDGVRAAVGGADITATRAVLAVQGPSARRRIASVVPQVHDIGRFRVGYADWRGTSCIVAGTGYTGEDGIEIAVPAESAGELWDDIVAAGITPAGLGARDTLRLEAALPLHGHELGAGITPLQAGLGWVVAWDKPEFAGREALMAERARGPHRHLVGLATEGRRPPRHGAALRLDGREIGVVTSGNYSPVLEHGIALGFVPTDVTTGHGVEIDLRGTALTATVVDTPFVRR